MSFELSLKVSTIYGDKNVPVNVPIKEHDGKMSVKKWLFDGKMVLKVVLEMMLKMVRDCGVKLFL